MRSQLNRQMTTASRSTGTLNRDAALARHTQQAGNIRARVESRTYLTPAEHAKKLRGMGLTFKQIATRLGCSAEHARRLAGKQEK